MIGMGQSFPGSGSSPVPPAPPVDLRPVDVLGAPPGEEAEEGQDQRGPPGHEDPGDQEDDGVHRRLDRQLACQTQLAVAMHGHPFSMYSMRTTTCSSWGTTLIWSSAG